MKHKLKSIGIFFLVVLIGYIFLSLHEWSYSLQQERDFYIQPTEKYITKHRSDLTTEIFQHLFTDAKRCISATPQTVKQQCEKEIIYRMAITVKEEDFLSKDEYGEYGWPTDLFFVKETPTSLAMIGWEGKYVDISSTTDKKWISVPLWLRMLTGHCHIFNKEAQTASNCEVYRTIQLPNHEIGYLIRLIGLDEDTAIQFIFIFPALLSFYMVGALFTGHLSEVGYYLKPLLELIAIFIIASIVTYHYYKHNK